MNEKIIASITDFIAKKSTKEYIKGTDSYEILKYGVAVLYYFATKTVLLIVVSIVLGILSYTLVFMIVLGGLRRYARGLHFKSNLMCTITGFLNYIVGIFLALNLEIRFWQSSVIFTACVVLNILYAPSSTENSPIKEKEKLSLKIKTLIVMVALFGTMLFIGEGVYRNIILFSTIIETVYVLPIAYRIFHERRG